MRPSPFEADLPVMACDVVCAMLHDETRSEAASAPDPRSRRCRCTPPCRRRRSSTPRSRARSPSCAPTRPSPRSAARPWPTGPRRRPPRPTCCAALPRCAAAAWASSFARDSLPRLSADWCRWPSPARPRGWPLRCSPPPATKRASRPSLLRAAARRGRVARARRGVHRDRLPVAAGREHARRRRRLVGVRLRLALVVRGGGLQPAADPRRVARAARELL